MGLNDTPSGNRFTIGLFGPRNAGKSSLVNRLLGQELVLTSEVAGTTTDPVYKSMELLPLGPVLFIDTAGPDDEGVISRASAPDSKIAIKRTLSAKVLPLPALASRAKNGFIARLSLKFYSLRIRSSRPSPPRNLSACR